MEHWNFILPLVQNSKNSKAYASFQHLILITLVTLLLNNFKNLINYQIKHFDRTLHQKLKLKSKKFNTQNPSIENKFALLNHNHLIVNEFMLMTSITITFDYLSCKRKLISWNWSINTNQMKLTFYWNFSKNYKKKINTFKSSLFQHFKGTRMEIWLTYSRKLND